MSLCSISSTGVAVDILINGNPVTDLQLRVGHPSNEINTKCLTGSAIMRLKKDDVVSFRIRSTGVKLQHVIEIKDATCSIQKLRLY
jgi:hypothetical protein